MSALVLPHNTTAVEEALAAIDAERISGIDADIIRKIQDPDQAPADFLATLAYEYSVDEWDPAWDTATKRSVIKASYEVHRHKGTAYALETAITAANERAVVEEWFEYGGSPYRFRLTVDLKPDEIWPPERSQLLARTALRTKNVRSRLETILLRRTTVSEGPFVGGLIHIKQNTQLAPLVPREVETRPHVYAAAVARATQTIRLQQGS